MMGPAYEQIKKKVGEDNFDKWIAMTKASM
jgi:hypothetical protein